MHAEVNVFSYRESPFFGCELTVNQLKYGGEEVWNHLQIRYSVSISCFTRKLSFFLQPLLPPFQHCLFSPETLWPFPVFLWYCICTSISLFPVSHLILKTNEQTIIIIKNNTLKLKKKNGACVQCGQKTVTKL